MPELAIHNARVVLPDRVLEGGGVTVEQGLISEVGTDPAPADEVIDAQGKYLLPGLIDLHTHGRLAIPDPNTIIELLRQDRHDLIRTGVTAYLVTFASAPLENWDASLDLLARELDKPGPGALPLGVHLEGTFINPAAAGAQPPAWIRPFNPDDPLQRGLFEKPPGLVRMVTFAPEIEGAAALVETCLRTGVKPSQGHTAADPQMVRDFAGRGADYLTHLMNGMKPLNHRDPGPVAAGLLDDRITVEIICDGFHVHPEMVRLVHRMKPPEKVVLITDSVTIDLPGATPGAPDEPNRLPDGRLAGSRLRLIRAVKNYLDFTGCPVEEAVAAASLNPARVIKVDNLRGSLEPGKVGDLVLTGPDFEPEAVFIRGQRVL